MTATAETDFQAANNRLVSTKAGYDAAGNMVSHQGMAGGIQALFYDGEGRVARYLTRAEYGSTEKVGG